MQSQSVGARLLTWKAESEEHMEPGEMCLVDEMHVLEYVRNLASILTSRWRLLMDLVQA